MTTVEFSYSLIKGAKALKPYALRLTNDVEEAKDLVQETLLKAFANRDKFTEGTNANAWLYTIMKNTFYTAYRRMVKRNAFIDSSSHRQNSYSPWTSNQNRAIGSFTTEDIEHALKGLKDRYRLPFDLYASGFKYHEGCF